MMIATVNLGTCCRVSTGNARARQTYRFSLFGRVFHPADRPAQSGGAVIVGCQGQNDGAARAILENQIANVPAGGLRRFPQV